MKLAIPAMLAVFVLISASALRAQTQTPQGLTSQPNQTDSNLTAETRHVFESTSDNILKAAREMPENAYSFKPVADARTFGELVAHIADVQTTLCAKINDDKPKPATKPLSKDNLLKDLASSQVKCQMAFSEISAQNANNLIQTPAGQATYLAALVYIITHASEEYGQMGIYLRLNHLAPPTSDNPKEFKTRNVKP